jgi:hypothetical protein
MTASLMKERCIPKLNYLCLFLWTPDPDPDMC